jgi:CheY-like chemotaxis protein
MSGVESKPASAAEEGTPLMRRPRPALHSWMIQVLVVDDDEADAALAVNILRRHPNVGSVVAIASPEEALAKLMSGRLAPHLILLDIQMPRINGFKFVEAIDRIPEVRDTPVVMLTTSRFERDVARARQLRASGYIIKPESPEEFRKRLDLAVRQAISGRPE